MLILSFSVWLMAWWVWHPVALSGGTDLTKFFADQYKFVYVCLAKPFGLSFPMGSETIGLFVSKVGKLRESPLGSDIGEVTPLPRLIVG